MVCMVLRAGERKHCWETHPSIVLTEESSRSTVEINGSPHLINNLVACLYKIKDLNLASLSTVALRRQAPSSVSLQ